MDSLKKLDLSGCGLTELYPLFECEKIEELNLSNNPLAPPVSSFFRGMDNLKKLDLSGCGLKELPYDLKICVNLQELNLSNNFFGHQDLLERLNSGNSTEGSLWQRIIKTVKQSGKESLKLVATNLTRIIFADANYTHINGG
jgi:Leucine-rich repeat (LRR) protein